MTVKSYAEFLKERGKPTYTMAGQPWMLYNHALVPAAVMPRFPRVEKEEARRLLRESGALFLRFTSDLTQQETNWWYIVCTNYEFDRLSRNTRSKIRRGLKRFQIRCLETEWLARHGHQCHLQSYERYENAHPLSERQFYEDIVALEGYSIFDLWGCISDGKLGGYIICIVEEDGVFFHTVDITPEALHNYASYAMIHHLSSHYVVDIGKPITNGSRSISHATRMQDFLMKFGFQRQYCTLNIVYRPDVAVAVRVLYPFRRLLNKLGKPRVLHQVRSVLFQEQLFREGMETNRRKN